MQNDGTRQLKWTENYLTIYLFNNHDYRYLKSGDIDPPGAVD